MHLHPMIVHLPLATWGSATLLYTVGRFVRSGPAAAHCAVAATINLVIGSIAAVAAVASGVLAATNLSVVGIAQDTLTHHVAWASLTTLLFMGITLLLAVGRSFTAQPGIGFLVALWLSTGALVATGYYGGRNVYRYGLGVDLAMATERATHPPPVVRAVPPPLP